MRPIIVDASEIRGVVGTSIDVSVAPELDAVDVSGVVYTPTSPANVVGSLTNSGEGLVLQGNVRASFGVPCSRCLTDVAFEIATDIDTLFVDDDSAADAEEQDILVFHGDEIDIAPVVISALRVEMPIAPLCSDECRGICPECGTDRNERGCDCHEKPREDSPFAALKDLVVDEADDS